MNQPLIYKDDEPKVRKLMERLYDGDAVVVNGDRFGLKDVTRDSIDDIWDFIDLAVLGLQFGNSNSEITKHVRAIDEAIKAAAERRIRENINARYQSKPQLISKQAI